MKIQTGMPLVVLTYPGHFLLTALTIRSYLEYHIPTEVIVVADDLCPHAWDTYLKDCQDLYWAPVIPVSQIPHTKEFNNGWVRQQIAKLYLDQVIDSDTWFFTDGDVEYHFPAPTNQTPWVVTRGGIVQDRQNKYVSDLLGINSPGIYTEHPIMDWNNTAKHQVCVSNPPFRTMSKSTLEQLRQHVEQLHSQSISDLHKDLDLIATGMSEWELIASFQQHILKQDLNLVYYPTAPLGQSVTPAPLQPDYCSTCFVTDSAFERAWWADKKITTTDRIWATISNISK